ncbi:MAG: RadC family protein [Oscillospiraceae bacterium]|nr:RadC family protein [Oscillospiraceae bacterium]
MAGQSTHAGHRSRVKQKFLNHGLDGFADHEVLELLLFYAIPQGDTNPTGHALMERFGTLDAVLAAPVEELQRVKGIGEHAAILLRLVNQVYRRGRMAAAASETILDTTARLGAFFVDLFVGQGNEIMYQLCLDAKGRMKTCRKLSEGDVGSVDLNIRRIVENALLCGAAQVVLAHNHPSGFAVPSHEDRISTIMVRDALETVNVRLVDHIIVADDDFVSMREDGVFG